MFSSFPKEPTSPSSPKSILKKDICQPFECYFYNKTKAPHNELVTLDDKWIHIHSH